MPTWNGKELTELEVAYLAGIVDGEGYMGICKSNHHDKYKTYNLKFIITTTSMELVNWVVEKLSLKIMQRKNNIYKNTFGKKIVFNCYTQNRIAVDLIKILYPYLVIKRKKAEIIINEWPLHKVIDNEQRTYVYNRLKQLTKEN